ncbi:MAG: hypothetical protein HKN89_04295 [Eudoraea sp.]|nr:hypothetical protein [Eudoraea sp.]
MSQTRLLATSMFVDIVGYTDMMQRDESAALTSLDKFKSNLEQEIPKFNGEIIQYFGDGCLAIFYSALEAVSCARQLQKQWQDQNLPVRVGLHLGDLVKKEDNVYGDSVNIASRIESMGIPGSILLSDSIRNSVKNQPDLNFQLLGSFEFKNVVEPIKVYGLHADDLTLPDAAKVTGKFTSKKTKSSSLKKWLVPILLVIGLLAVGYYGLISNSPPESEIDSSIAVLPFTNLSEDVDQDYLSAGFTSEINHQLSKIESLAVISQTITQQLVGQNKSFSEIAKELDVNYILEGTIQKAGERTRLITNLTRMKDNKLIWSEEFDLNEMNLIEAQIQVSTGIAEKLPLNISDRNFSALQKTPTSSPLAYEFYLKALDSFDDWLASLRQNETTIRYLEKAISLDANFAQAYAKLAQVYHNASTLVGADFEQLSTQSLHYANKAIQLDSLLPDPYIVIGRYENYKNMGSGLKLFSKANELDPKAGLFELYEYYRGEGEIISAFEYAILKIQRDPKSPYGYIGVAETHSQINNYDRSIEILEHLIGEGFKSDYIVANLINNYYNVGKFDNAITLINKYVIPRDSLGGLNRMGITNLFSRNWEEAEGYYLRLNNKDMDLALIHLNTGREKSANALFQAAIDRRLAIETKGTWQFRDLSRIYAAMGEFETCYEYLDILDERGDLHYSWIHADPFFDRIRNKKRFQEFCDRITEKKEMFRRQIQNLEKDLNLDI